MSNVAGREEEARAALDAGDLVGALQAALAMLAAAPGSSVAQALLADINGEVDAGADVSGRGAWLALIGQLDAYVAGMDGEHEEALSGLLESTAARPGLACGAWLARWFPDDAALKRVGPEAVRGGLLAWTRRTVARDTLDVAELASFEPFVPIVEKLCRNHARDPVLQLLASNLLRKVGRRKSALLLAERAHKLHPSVASHIAVAFAQRALGDRAAAVRTFRTALKEAPEEGSLMAHLGDLYLELGETGPASTWFERARPLVPERAEAGLCAVRLREGAPGHWLDRLHELAASADSVVAECVRMLIAAVGATPPTRPYEDFLPDPTEASFNVLRQLVRESGDGAPHSLRAMALSNLESPSVWLAFDLFYRSRGSPERVTPAVVPGADVAGLGSPSRPVMHLLWRYEAGQARVAVEPPAPRVAEPLRALAAERFELATWAQSAGRLAAELGDVAADVLGCMVHLEPQAPRWTDPGRWVRAQQHAAALVLAHMDTGPWPTSRRRELLHDLVHGPLDWSVEAAVVAATWVARQDPVAAEEIGSWLEAVTAALPPVPCPYARAIASCGSRIPGLSAPRRRCFEALADRLADEARQPG